MARKNRPVDDISLEEAHKIRMRFRMLAAASLLYLGIGTVMMMWIEKFSFIDSLYFSVVSLTTVGYGDLSPATTLGKVFVMIYLIVGIGIIAALINNVVKSVLARRIINESLERDKASE